MSATESVGDSVKFTRLVLDGEGELLQIGNPISMLCRDFNRTIQVFQCVMISEKDEITIDKVMSPVPYRLNHRIKFNIIRVVSSASSCQLSAKECHRTRLLTQHNANTQLGCITMQLKSLIKVW